MPKWMRLDELTERGSAAIEQALSGRELPERSVAVTSGFEGSVATITYVLVGKRPEDGVELARAKLDRATGKLLSVEVHV
jgi:hypothetical protein